MLRNDNMLEARFDEFSASFLKRMEDKRTRLDSLINEISQVETENKTLCEKVTCIEEELCAVKLCIHCNSEFTKKINREDSCIYHPGKIKYYSCRSCGKDEYHVCCNKCSKCSKGCKRAKHVTEVR